jgi:hypothetical protein
MAGVNCTAGGRELECGHQPRARCVRVRDFATKPTHAATCQPHAHAQWLPSENRGVRSTADATRAAGAHTHAHTQSHPCPQPTTTRTPQKSKARGWSGKDWAKSWSPRPPRKHQSPAQQRWPGREAKDTVRLLASLPPAPAPPRFLATPHPNGAHYVSLGTQGHPRTCTHRVTLLCHVGCVTPPFFAPIYHDTGARVFTNPHRAWQGMAHDLHKVWARTPARLPFHPLRAPAAEHPRHVWSSANPTASAPARPFPTGPRHARGKVQPSPNSTHTGARIKKQGFPARNTWHGHGQTILSLASRSTSTGGLCGPPFLFSHTSRRHSASLCSRTHCSSVPEGRRTVP